jgi:hypothetical protein
MHLRPRSELSNRRSRLPAGGRSVRPVSSSSGARLPMLSANVVWFCGLLLMGPIEPTPSIRWPQRHGRVSPVTTEILSEARCRIAREIVTLDVGDTSLTVFAEYTFMKRHITADAEGVVLPFVADPSMGKPSLVNATISYDDGAYSNLDVNTLPNDAWICDLQSDYTRSAVVRLAYARRLYSRRVGHCLTSRSNCGMTVDSAAFTVRFHPIDRTPHFNLPFTRGASDPLERIWTASFVNWTSKKNLMIKW